ncbi:hypothetical protein Q9L58_000294 [Maublancomyces gigas]|uniref:Uncharacterized protein n=1 Tax=Discina gigas TaxID=1032678 RepID=A0ABR3GXE0_9PEZI
MPSLMPLLSSSSNAPSSAPVSSKKAAKKLRRKNPPPSLSTNHQKLPSSAGSSTYDLPKSRPSSSRSFHNITSGDGWFATLHNPLPAPLPTPHPNTSTNGRRKSGPNIDYRSQDEFTFRPMTPPESGSPELGYQRPQHHNHHSLPSSGPSAYNSPLTLSKQNSFPIQQTLVSPPSKIVKGRGPDAFKAFSYDSYNNMPVSPPPQSPPANSIPPTYLGTAQYPNNLLQQPPTPQRAQTFPTPLNTDLAPPTAFQLSQMGRTPNGSPILPPLPSFQSGGFGFDLPNTNNNDNRFTQTNTGRQRFKPASPPLPSPGAPPLPERRRPTVFTESGMHSSMLDSPLMESPLIQSPGDYIFHALTAEEPISLPSSAEQTPESSPRMNESPQPPTKGRVRRKSDAVSSFLGGWKLAMMGSSHSSSTLNNEKSTSTSSESDAPPVGVGDGGGWIHRRKGSFSSTRPPSREKSKHGAYAQEYKEFRAQKQAEGTPSKTSSKASSKASSKRSSKDSVSTSPVEGTGVSAILGNSPTKEQKMKGIEVRRNGSDSEGIKTVNIHLASVEPAKIETSEVVSLDVAVRQMNLLEERLSKGRPLSPPDSRDGEKPAPVGTGESDKGYHAGSEYSQTDTTLSTPQNSRQNSAQSSARNSGTSSPAGSINQKSQLHSAPRPSLAKQTTADKGKSRSPLRNEIDSDSVSSSSDEKKERERKNSPRHPASSEFSLGKVKNTGTGLGDLSSGSRPPTPPKPIAKLFVICCRCKYWHDLPSVMYRGMVENGGATRCPYCLHGMEVSCCAGYVFAPLLARTKR